MIKIFEKFGEYQAIKRWLDNMAIENYIINDDLTVDVNSNLDIRDEGLSEIPVQFGRIGGYFKCKRNSLTSLKGCPKYIKNGFYCDDNLLTSLEYFPGYVGGTISMRNNKLTSLKGCPKIVDGSFDVSENMLTSLEYCPDIVKDSFYCIHNELTTLKGGPKDVYHNYFATYNKLINLIGIHKVGNDIQISNNHLPYEVMQFFDVIYLVNNQDEYGIWNSDGTLNKKRWDVFYKEYTESVEED